MIQRFGSYFCLMLILSIGAFWPNSAKADDCPFFFSGHIERADVIFVGKLIKQEYVGWQRAKLGYKQPDLYAKERGETPLWKWKLNLMEVTEVFKGDMNDMTVLVSPRFFTSGEEYIIFARRTKDLDRYNATEATFVNEVCDKTEHVHPKRGSDLLDDVRDELGGIRFK